jgi:hypothetical protein
MDFRESIEQKVRLWRVKEMAVVEEIWWWIDVCTALRDIVKRSGCGGKSESSKGKLREDVRT